MSKPLRPAQDTSGRATEIIFLHPSKPAVDFSDYVGVGAASPYMLMPVGVPGMINLLRQHGFNVSGLNVPLETMLDRRFSLGRWLRERRSVKLIAIDLHWYEHAFGALDVARLCKRVNPEVPVVLGGLTASYFATQILEGFPEVDFIIRGDGERPLLELARLVSSGSDSGLSKVPNLTFRRNGQLVETDLAYCAATEDLDDLDFVDMGFLAHAEQYHEVEFSLSERVDMAGDVTQKGHWLTIGRGCHFDCTFCGGGRAAHLRLAGRKGVVTRTPARVVDDLARMQQQGFQQVSFNLDPAIMGKAYWSELFSQMRERGVKIGVYNEFFQLPVPEFVDQLVASVDLDYTEVAFTPLTGSDKVRKRNGKHFTNEKLLNTLTALRAHRIPVFLYFSLNLPGENKRAFRQTLALAEKACEIYPSERLRMINMCHTVDPYSPMSRQPQRYKIDVEFRHFMDYYRYCQETPVLRRDVSLDAWRGYSSSNGTGAELEKFAKQWDDFCTTQEARCYAVPRTW